MESPPPTALHHPYTAAGPFDPPPPQPKPDFVIEDLLDFSNDDDDVITDTPPAAFDSLNSTDSSTVTVVDSCNSSYGGDYPHGFPDNNISGDLCVPYDDIAELEWLSNFVEESFSSEDLQKLQLISGMKAAAGTEAEPEKNRAVFRPEMSVPGKARSKRSRAAPCNWSSRLLVLSPSPTSSNSSSESDLTANSGKRMLKKKELSGHGDGRKCLHCATDKTPQWRTGPLGPKTLCNACGVRYKSGRLVPEYRPASSPTFVLAKHSNSHRKVMELRRQKEMQQRNQHEHFLYPNPTDLFDVSGCADDYLIHHPAGSGFTHLI